MTIFAIFHLHRPTAYCLLAHGLAAWRDELAPAGETTVVFRGSEFADDVAKTNLTATLKQRGLPNVRSV